MTEPSPGTTEPRSLQRLVRPALVALYILTAILTFGHAWNRDYSTDPRVQRDQAFVASPVCAIFWPLYWSAYIFQANTQLRDAAPTQPQTLSTDE